MFISLLCLLGGLFLIIKGGAWFVAASVRIAEFLRMPRVVIGGTLVSLATTAPELVVSLVAGARGESDLAVGNAVGSCICNIALILGVTAAIKHVDVNPRALRMPLLVLLGTGIGLFLMTWNLRLSRWQGGVLVLIGAAYLVLDFVRHYRDRKPEDEKEAEAIEQEMAAERWAWMKSGRGTVVQFLVGAVVVVLGSRLLVQGAVDVAVRLGIPSIVIGLTVVAVGTSLPELVTAITSSRQGVSDLAVGNVIGANVANATFIVGSAAALHEVRMDRITQAFNFPAMLVVTGMLVWMLLTERRLSRREGVLLLGSYGFYVVALVGLTLWSGH